MSIRFLAALITVCLALLPSIGSAQGRPASAHAGAPPERAHVHGVVYALGVNNILGAAGGIAYGTDRLYVGLYGQLLHPLPELRAFALDAEADVYLGWQMLGVTCELYLGMGVSAETESASARANVFVMAPPPRGRWVGFLVNPLASYFPEALNFRHATSNRNQFDFGVRVGPMFRIAGNLNLFLTPWVEAGFADSDALDHWRGRVGFYLAYLR